MEDPEPRTSSAKSKNRSEAHKKLRSSPLSSTSLQSLSSITTTSSTSLSVHTRLTKENQIRCRLFYRLGIDPAQPVQKYTKSTLNTRYQYYRAKNLPVPFFQPIRDSISTFGTVQELVNVFTKSVPERYKNHQCDTHGERDTNDSNCALTQTGSGSIRKKIATVTPNNRAVRFDRNVLVIPIPSRHSYSNRTKKALWRDKNELRETTDRNRCEYLSEGWEWNRVVEDEDMYFDVATGQKIHPYWVECGDGDVDGHECKDGFNDTDADIEARKTKKV